MSEETHTETALLNIALKHQSGSLVVKPATKSAEGHHGADWLWWFVRGNKGISCRVQAKRLFRSGRYESLLKSGKDKRGRQVDPYEQLHKLVTTAQRAKAIPLYCFYNFDLGAYFFRGPNSCVRHNYRVPSFWGCSLSLPNNVLRARSDHLADLERFMMPWHRLVCGHGNLLANTAAGIGHLANPNPDFDAHLLKRQTDAHLIGRQTHIRPEPKIDVQAIPLPRYVVELVEAYRGEREAPDDERDNGKFYRQAQIVCGEQDVEGLVLFEEKE